MTCRCTHCSGSRHQLTLGQKDFINWWSKPSVDTMAQGKGATICASYCLSTGVVVDFQRALLYFYWDSWIPALNCSETAQVVWGEAGAVNTNRTMDMDYEHIETPPKVQLSTAQSPRRLVTGLRCLPPDEVSSGCAQRWSCLWGSACPALSLLKQQPSAVPLVPPSGLQTAPPEFRTVNLPQQLRGSWARANPRYIW